MAYKDGSKPQKGDAVLGVIAGQPARGKVMSYSEKDDTIMIQRRGNSIFHAKSGQMIQGPLEQIEAEAADFELLIRPAAKAPAKAAAIVANRKEA